MRPGIGRFARRNVWRVRRAGSAGVETAMTAATSGFPARGDERARRAHRVAQERHAGDLRPGQQPGDPCPGVRGELADRQGQGLGAVRAVTAHVDRQHVVADWHAAPARAAASGRARTPSRGPARHRERAPVRPRCTSPAAEAVGRGDLDVLPREPDRRLASRPAGVGAGIRRVRGRRARSGRPSRAARRRWRRRDPRGGRGWHGACPNGTPARTGLSSDPAPWSASAMPLDQGDTLGRVPHKDPHVVLGVEPGASPDEIKAAWRALARRHHPDLTGDDPEVARRATRRMAEINAAYAALTRAGETIESQRRRAAAEAAARDGDGGGCGRGHAAPRRSTPTSQDAPGHRSRGHQRHRPSPEPDHDAAGAPPAARRPASPAPRPLSPRAPGLAAVRADGARQAPGPRHPGAARAR